MSEAKVKNFLLLAGGRNKKLVNHKGSNFGGPDGVSMSSLICYNCLKFSRIMSPPLGVAQIRLTLLQLLHLCQKST